MSGFSIEWLALREPYDVRARNRRLLDAVVAAMSALPSVSIVDLACGAGSTLRALEPRLSSHQNWRLVDNNLSLLARAADTPRSATTSVSATPVDLALDLEAALDGAVDLVTTSALLDLVSKEWLERLATEIAVRRLPFYAALTYDGRIELTPGDPLDAQVVRAVNTHQLGDKGFGPALGPAAAQTAAQLFESVGYVCELDTADWMFEPRDEEIQTELLLGWAGAARDTGLIPIEELGAWLQRRQGHVAARGSSIRVGHLDLLAQPKDA